MGVVVGSRQIAGSPHAVSNLHPHTIRACRCRHLMPLSLSSSQSCRSFLARKYTRTAASCVAAASCGGQHRSRHVQQHEWSSAASSSHPVARAQRTTARAASNAAVSGDHAPAKGKILALLAFALLVGVSNRVLYRMALVPMQDYVFFLAQFTTFGYTLVYFGVLLARIGMGAVTPAMLRIPLLMLPLFLLIGALEGSSGLLLMIGSSHLSGAVLPLLAQAYLVWNLLFVWLILKQRLTLPQVCGALTVSLGVVIAALPNAASTLQFDPNYALLVCAAYALPALDSIIKEKVFTDAKAQLGGQPLDIFIVNSFGSLCQAFIVTLLLPLMAQLRGLSWGEVPAYISNGCVCLLGGQPTCGADCTGAPLLPLLYIGVNLVFNITLLYLLRQLGNVTLSLSVAAIVPLTILAFCLPLPLLEPAVLGPSFSIGACVLMLGLLLYNSSSWGLKWPWSKGGGGGAKPAGAAG